MKLKVEKELLDSIASVYGEKCKLHLLALIENADQDADLQEMLSQAYERTYANQFHPDDAILAKLRFNSR